MKYTISLLALLSASAASAATVSVASTVPTGGNIHGAAGAQVQLKDSAGNIIPVGARIRVGFFVGGLTPSLQTTLSSGGFFDLPTDGSTGTFVPLGEAASLRAGYGTASDSTNVTKLVAGAIRWSVTLSNVTYQGATSDPLDNNTIADGGVPRGTRLFVIAYNQNGYGTAATPGFEWGIYSDPTTFVIPESGTATLSLNVALVDQPSEVFWGSLGSLGTLPAIPEPATGMLGLLAGLGLITRRRR